MFAMESTAAALIAGFLLGVIHTWSTLRRIRRELAQARWSAEHDPLTNLPNRAGARRHHQREVAAGRQQAAVLIDLDGFKAVNDTWGHETGDAYLTMVAERLTSACHAIDALASRLAGDEFLLLLPYAAPLDVLEQVTAIFAELGKAMTLTPEGTTVVIAEPSASAGIALPEPGSTWTDLLGRADIALYQAKTIRGEAVLYSSRMQRPTPRSAPRGPRLRQLAQEEGRHLPLPDADVVVRVAATLSRS